VRVTDKEIFDSVDIFWGVNLLKSLHKSQQQQQQQRVGREALKADEDRSHGRCQY
jgi:hypothetical protein